MTLAPVRLAEAADSMMKATVHEPVGKPGGPGLWRHKGLQLPAYIQHIANDLREGGKSESVAIATAIAAVKRWAAGGGSVHPDTRAAAAKAVAEWEALKARAHASSAARKATESAAFAPWLERELRERAAKRIDVMGETLGEAGTMALLDGSALLEAATVWAPELKRVASASTESMRHELHDNGQHVGTIAQRPGMSPGDGPRWSAMAVNGSRVCDSHSLRSQQQAVDAIRRHLEEAPGRVTAHTNGKYLVANVPGYSGQTSYTEFPNEPAARHAAGLPALPSSPERASQVQALGEMLEFDLATVAGSLLEFDPAEARDPHGRWLRVGTKVLQIVGDRRGVLTHTVDEVHGDGTVTIKTPDAPSLGGGARKRVPVGSVVPKASLTDVERRAILADELKAARARGRPNMPGRFSGSQVSALRGVARKRALARIDAHDAAYQRGQRMR